MKRTRFRPTRRHHHQADSPSRRGASLVTYVAVVGLVALGVSVAVTRTGDEVRGITTKIAGSVNAVDGALSGNRGPAYQGPALTDQSVDEFDAMAAIDARGFVDPEGDRLDYTLSLTGGLKPADLTVQDFADGLVIDGTPGASGTLAVVATDPIGRRATAGPVQITVAPNQPPAFTDAGAVIPAVEAGESLPEITLGSLQDTEGDAIGPAVVTDAGSGQAANFSVTGEGAVKLTGTPDQAGQVSLTVTWEDAHGAQTSFGPVVVDVLPDNTSCRTILETGGDAGDKLYAIDPEGDGTTFQAFCDMTTDGGGWTLASKVTSPTGMDPDAFYAARMFKDSWTADSGGWQNTRPLLTRGNARSGSISDVYAGMQWQDLRMSCSRSSNASSEEHFVTVEDYAAGATTELLEAYTNGTAFTVNPAGNSFAQTTVWHDNEYNRRNSNHYVCDIYESRHLADESHQFGFCYTDFLNNVNDQDKGDSIVSIGVTPSSGYVNNRDWAAYYYGECGDMGEGYLSDAGTFWIYVR